MNLYKLSSVLLLLFSFWNSSAYAQERRAVNFTFQYDEPKKINKLYLKFQPIYGELFTTNTTAGFGLDLEYYYKEKFNLIGGIRLPYAQSFDKERDHAMKLGEKSAGENKGLYTKEYTTYLSAELGITYHLKDFVKDKELRLILINPTEIEKKGRLNQVPNYILIPAKLRKILGLRLGTFYYQSAISLDGIISKQALSLEPVLENTELPNLEETKNAFTNFNTTGLYAGVSLSWIRNVIVKTNKRYGNLADNSILDLYFDLMYAPSIKIDELLYQEKMYQTSEIKTNPIGARLGIMNKHSKTITWAYGAEIGYKPGIANRGFYALLKISFPVFSTGFEGNQVEAFGK